MIAGHILDQCPASVFLEHDEVTHQREEPVVRTGALQHHLKFGHVRVGQGFARDCPPRLEPFPPGREGADSSLDAVGDHEDLVHGEQGGEFGLVGLELLPSGPDRRVFVRRVLELDHAQRQTVDKLQDVGPAGVLMLRNGKLIDSQPVIVGRVLEIDRAWAPRTVPSTERYSTVTPSTNIRWKARLRVSRVAPPGRVSLREASASTSGGRSRLRWVSAACNRGRNTTPA